MANARKVADRGEPQERRSAGCTDIGAAGPIDPELLYPGKHHGAQAQADLAMIGARAGLVRGRSALVNTARNLVKSYGERVELLKQIKGVGTLIALTFLLTLEDPHAVDRHWDRDYFAVEFV